MLAPPLKNRKKTLNNSLKIKKMSPENYDKCEKKFQKFVVCWRILAENVANLTKKFDKFGKYFC